MCFLTYMADDDPEMPTTETWRTWMRERREALSITQGELGRRVGTSQPSISDIESGKLKGSSLVLPISRILGIPPPYVPIEHDEERRLLEAGRDLRRHNRDVFLAQLQALEVLASSLTPKG